LVKTITIRDEVYRKLLSVKRKDESFSELFDRLTENKTAVETLKKLRASVEFSEGEKDDILFEIRSKRAERRSLNDSD
jgi:predicted CopG family antitoxin